MGLKRLAPDTYERSMAKKGKKDQFTGRPAPRSSGNLYRPMEGSARMSGGWLEGGGRRHSKAGTTLLTLAAVAAVPMLAAYARRDSSHRSNRCGPSF